MPKRWWRVVWVGVALAVAGGCAKEGTNPPKPEEEAVPNPDIFTCWPGRNCLCPSGRSGTTVCEGNSPSCRCEECPALQIQSAPTVTSCGGEPFGTWRLSQLELGAQQLSLSVAGSPVGTCDTMLASKGPVPRLLMSLQDGGFAQYFAETAASIQSWSESCVTSKVAQFSCGSREWTGVFNCKLACDICTCDSEFRSTDDDSATWRRTEATLTVAPWGKSANFEYCVEGNELKLSTQGLYLVFQRVHTLSNPAPCAGRTAEGCVTGEGCFLGACMGGPDCAVAGTEGNCLTRQGCSWDAAQCRGQGQRSCGLKDFGKVPGCDYTEQQVSCTGAPPACETLDATSCEQLEGCTKEESGFCAGSNLACEDFLSCPLGQCSFSGSRCLGSTSCGAFIGQAGCDYVSEENPRSECTWQARHCKGTAKPCAEYSQAACEAVPGCMLTTAAM